MFVIEIYFGVYLFDQLFGLEFEVVFFFPVHEDALHCSLAVLGSNVNGSSLGVEE